MMLRFTPNAYGRAKFGLKFSRAESELGCTDFMIACIGRRNYDRYCLAQDLFYGGRTAGEVRIITNPDETVPLLMEFATIGIMEKIK